MRFKEPAHVAVVALATVTCMKKTKMKVVMKKTLRFVFSSD